MVLSFLAEDSLEQAILKSDDLRDAAGEGDSVHFRTPRRSKSAHYGCVRHTLAYLLRSFNCSTPSCKMVSLLLRSQMLAMAAHDLQFVKHVSTAERSVLNLACRQLAYKAAKMGSRASGAASEAASTLLTADELANVRESIAALNRRLLNTPGAEPEATAPPPLILCEASAHLGRPSIATILGLNDGAELLFPKRAPSPEGDGTSSESSQSIVDVSDEAFSSSSEDPQDQPTVIGAESFAFRSGGRSKSVAAIEDAEVVGLYFSAGWCPACKTVTPMIAEAYKALTSRGKKMEICFVTLDKNEQDFNAMRTEMPWPALPFGGTRHALLASAFDVQCVPTLVLLRPNGTIISTDGIRLLRKHARTFPWLSATPPPATPHLHPLYERLLRPHQVDAGLPRELPGYAPIDFLQLPIQVHSFADAVRAVRLCDRLTTLVAVQAHCVKNGAHLSIALIQHTVTQLLPMPKPEARRWTWSPDDKSPPPALTEARPCIWRGPLRYADQLDLLILLQRLSQHFTAAAFSLDHTRSMDGVRIVVPTCMAAVADCVLRQMAIDLPSDASRHLRGFSLSAGWLSKQAATIGVHQVELNLARAAALDYFDSLRHLPKLFEWHKSDRLDQATALYLKSLCKDVAFSSDQGHLHEYLVDTHALVMKNYPELECYRDIAYYQKLFLNPDARCFPQKNAWTQREAELLFVIEPPCPGKKHCSFVAKAFRDFTLSCRPKVKKGEMPPTHRFSELSNPSEYTRPFAVESEDDVLHMWELPGAHSLRLQTAI